jgi:prepilin peptidase CpaA
MAFAVTASYAVLVLAGALLVYLAVADLKEYRIRNELVLALGGLFLVYALVSGRWMVLHWHLAFAAGMFVLMLFSYSRGWMGGGDLKLLTVAFLWTGLLCAVPFLLGLLAFSLLHTLVAWLGWAASQQVHGRMRVAFAPSIAAGLITVFLIGCLRPL